MKPTVDFSENQLPVPSCLQKISYCQSLHFIHGNSKLTDESQALQTALTFMWRQTSSQTDMMVQMGFPPIHLLQMVC